MLWSSHLHRIWKALSLYNSLRYNLCRSPPWSCSWVYLLAVRKFMCLPVISRKSVVAISMRFMAIFIRLTSSCQPTWRWTYRQYPILNSSFFLRMFRFDDQLIAVSPPTVSRQYSHCFLRKLSDKHSDSISYFTGTLFSRLHIAPCLFSCLYGRCRMFHTAPVRIG
mgnify:FL=1